MAKRFSQTGKWHDEWFSELSPIEKLVFLFIIDNCDNAGFLEVNARVNSYIIGITQEEYLGAYKGLTRGLIFSADGKKIWVKKFLFHQKNTPLNPQNNAHGQIISLIENQLKNFPDLYENLGADKGLFSPIGKGIVKVEYSNGNSTDIEIFEKWISDLKENDFVFDEMVMSKGLKLSKTQIAAGLDDYLGLIAQYPNKQNVKDITHFRYAALKHLKEFKDKKPEIKVTPNVNEPGYYDPK